jgi:radical SAM protein with 4Fe4S-binding SPASM domain
MVSNASETSIRDAEATSRRGLADENQKLNSKELSEGKSVLNSFPYQVQIGADNRCNLRCGFCLADAYREQGWVHIQDRKLELNPIKLFEKLVPVMPYWRLLSLTGPGESLLNPRIGDILQLVRENSDCTVIVTTNGVLINKRLASILVEGGVDEISISLDSLNKDTFERLRVNGKVEKAIGAIDLLNEEKVRRSVELPRINLTPTFFHMNIREVPNFIDFAASREIEVVQASPGQVYRKDWIKQSLLHHPDLTRKMATAAELRAQDREINFINNLRTVYINRGAMWKRLFRKEEDIDFPTDPSSCMKPWASLFVEPDGETRPCCYPSPVYGNLFESSFEEIWNGREAQQLRQSMIENKPPEQCQNCYEFNRHRPEIMIELLGE